MSPLPPSIPRREFIALATGAAAVLVAGIALGSAGEAAPQTAHAHDGAATTDPHASARAQVQALSELYQAPESLDELPWNLQLISAAHPLPDSFEAPVLREVGEGDHAVDERVADDLAAMLAAARADGVNPEICSSYRTYDYQQRLFEKRVRRAEKEEGLEGEAAEEAAAFWVAPPGASEHNAGLAVDIVDADYQELDERQETTATQQWLIDHCVEYGFILRYPTDKSDITCIGYEPWHYRYVGREFAPAITESGLCFEEWLQNYLADAQ